MEQTERIDYALGQIASLKAFCLALMHSHPAPHRLRDLFATMVDQDIDRSSYDGTAQGFAEMSAALLQAVSAKADAHAGARSGMAPLG